MGAFFMGMAISIAIIGFHGCMVRSVRRYVRKYVPKYYSGQIIDKFSRMALKWQSFWLPDIGKGPLDF